MTQTDRDKEPRSQSLNRREVCLVLVVLICGVALRVVRLEATAVEHFDEGVYASNLWFTADEGFEYPDRHLYAPPLLPWLIEWSMSLFGPGHLGTMLPTLLAGCATLPLVWWVAREWFGARSALAAVCLAAFSEVHALYSRTALTDVSMCFWLLLAVYAIWKSFSTATYHWTVVAGLATGLAWWTKYNGWLPLAIGLAGVVPWIWLEGRQHPTGDLTTNTGRRRHPDRRPRGSAQKPVQRSIRARPTVAILQRWLVLAGIAVLVWSPVLSMLQSQGGYAAVAENHSRYVVGPAGWLAAAGRQVDSHRYLSGLLSCLGMALAAVMPAFLPPGSTWNREASSPHSGEPDDASPPSDGYTISGSLVLLATAAALSGAAAIAGATTVLAALGACSLLMQLGRDLLPSRSAENSERPTSGLQTWLLAAWFFGLLLVTPMYAPYPRITLVWLMASWLATGAFLQGVNGSSSIVVASHSGQGRQTKLPAIGGSFCALVGIACFVFAGPRLIAKGIPAWEPRTGMERVAAAMVGDTAASADDQPRDPAVPADFVIYVYGEPALFFHLSRLSDVADDFAVQPAGNLGVQPLPVPTYLAVGPHALRSDKFRTDWEAVSDRFRLIKTYAEDSSDLVLLNHYTAEELEAGSRPRQELRLYLLVPLEP